MDRIVLDGGGAVKGGGRGAAFYDLDGTLLPGNVVTHYLAYAATDRTPLDRARRVLGTAVRAPLYALLDRLDRRTFNEVFYRSYAGLSEDRLAILGEELARSLEKRLYAGARDLVDGDRRAGLEPVLVTGALEPVAAPLAQTLGMKHYAANRLEFGADGVATGRLLPPVLAGPEKAVWVRRFAAEHGIDLEACRAYADDAADCPMLAMVGHPVAVNPDWSLRATARANGWPVVDLDRGERSGAGFGFQGLLQRALEAVR